MVELKLYVSDVDYDALIKTIGGAAGGAAALAAKALPDSAKESFAVKYINSNSSKLESMLETMAANKGVSLHVSGAQAAVVEQS